MQSLICSIRACACLGAVRGRSASLDFYVLCHRQPLNHCFISYYFFPQVSTACIQGSKTFAYSVLNVAPIPSTKYKNNANGAGIEIPGRLVKITT